MTNNGIRGLEALVAFATTFGSVGCGAPAGEPVEATEEPPAAAAEDGAGPRR